MLSNEKLEHHMTQLQLPLEIQEEIAHIRSSPPARRTRSSTVNGNTRYPSVKMGHIVQAESSGLELICVLMWENDDSIYEFYDQPPQLRLSVTKNNGVKSLFDAIPDFFVIGADFTGWVECKFESKLESEVAKGKKTYAKVDGKWEYLPGKAHAQERGLQYVVITENQFPPALVRNMKFLSRYYDCDYPAVSTRERKKLISYFQDGKIILADLLDKVIADPSEHPDGVDAVYKMIADKQLFLEIEKKLITNGPTQDHSWIFATEADLTKEQVLQLHDEKNLGVTTLPVLSVSLEKGASLLWSGTRYTVFAQTSDQIFLQSCTDPDHIPQLRRTEADALIRAGLLMSAETVTLSNANPFLDLLKSRHPKEIEKGVWKAKQVESNQNLNRRTRDLWIQRKREGLRDFGNELAYLISREKDRGNRTPRLAPEVYALMEEFNKKQLEVKKNPLKLYWVFHSECTAAGLKVPSIKAYRRHLKKLTSEYELIKTVQGEKAAYAQEQIFFDVSPASTPHGERPFELAHIDHTELALQLRNSQNNQPMGRPYLTIMVDSYTRMVLAYVITFYPPSKVTLFMVIKECIRRHGRLPEALMTDNGPDSHSTYYETTLAVLQVQKRERPPSKSRWGGIVENDFLKLQTDLINHLQGSTQHMTNPRSVSKSHNPVETAVWTFGRLNTQLKNYFYDSYANTPHGGIGTSPKEFHDYALQRNGKGGRQISYEAIKEFVLPEYEKKVTYDPKDGILVNGMNYFCEEMKAFRHGASFPVRYDPRNIGYVVAKIGGKWIHCKSPQEDRLRSFSDEEVEMVSAEYLSRNSRYTALAQAAGMKRGEFLAQALKAEHELREEKRAVAEGLKEQEMINAKAAATATPVKGAVTAKKPSKMMKYLQGGYTK